MARTTADIIAQIDASQFTRDFLGKILELGIGTYSKNDLYDFILYTANKNDPGQFLDKQSNYDNAVLLKVSETKVKNSKLNISLKFKTQREKENVLDDFLFKIANKQIKITEDAEKLRFIFYLDDRYVRMVFENQLKTEEGITLDYAMNQERVTIEKVHFLRFLRTYSKKTEDFFIKQLSGQLKNDALKSQAGNFVSKLLSVVKDITASVLAEMVKQACLPSAGA